MKIEEFSYLKLEVYNNQTSNEITVKVNMMRVNDNFIW